MNFWQKTLLWCMLLACMTGLFHLIGDTSAQASADGRTPMTILVGGEPVFTTMADWLPCAVAAEMPVSFGPEALKAQAVAARTFALANTRHENADVCTDGGCCVAFLDEPALRERWGADFARNMQCVRDAVAATDGEYLTYGGQPIQAAFHASSAGFTESSAAIWSPVPYLVSVSSPESAEAVPGLVTTVSLTADELAAALGLASPEDPAGWLQDAALDPAGRVESMTVCGKRFSGSQLRSRLGLRSTAFTAAWDGTAFTFTVSGYGHGVGMSQYGAWLYAAQGMGYREILAHYYPGTALAGGGL